ncbi:MAG: glycerophosphodiester phosphodiesterase family protein [bacterium]
MKLQVIGTSLLLFLWPAVIIAFASDQKQKPNKRSKSILVIAHRGASGYAPENTIAAFKRAIELGADMYELDCYLTKDGEIVVIHDDDVERTTNGSGKVSELTLGEIKKLDAGSWFGEEFAGESVPTLREALDLAKGKILVNIEIKEAGFEKQTVELVEELEMVEDVMVTGFDHSVIKKIKDMNPKIKTGALVKDITPEEIETEILKLNTDAINPRYIAVNKKLVKAAHEHGLEVNPYTVNDVLAMKMQINSGVDGIITNYPDVLLKLLGREKIKEKESKNDG